LRILLISYDVARRGGIERLTLQVREALEAGHHRVDLLCPSRLGSGTLGRWLGRGRFLLALAFLLPQAEVVLCMHALLLAPLRWLAPLGGLSRRGRGPAGGRRCLCWLHGLEVWGEALSGVEADLRHCDRLIASSHFTAARVLEQGGPWPATVVVHPMADLVDARRTPSPLPASPRLLTVARMDGKERYKGHRTVLAALEMLRERGHLAGDLEWRVVGDGNDRSDLEQECEARGLTPWVRFLGGLDDEELETELRRCSLLLLPSAYQSGRLGRAGGEGFGIVYLEAAQAGRASIACREGGQSDLIVEGRTGWLIDPDPKALADCLEAVLADPEGLAEAGEQARQRALASFGAERFKAALLRAIVPVPVSAQPPP
jgi:phosphatidylinositol alpha-1,6-mannosyltransferase